MHFSSTLQFKYAKGIPPSVSKCPTNLRATVYYLFVTVTVEQRAEEVLLVSLTSHPDSRDLKFVPKCGFESPVSAASFLCRGEYS